MAFHCYYQTLFGLIIILAMMNTNLVQSAFVPNECFNYCSIGGVCLKSKDGPKCICLPKWTGERCDLPQNSTLIQQINASQANTTDLRNNLCISAPDDFCQHNGICYVDTANNVYACYCRYPYIGDNCEDTSDCYNYCENNGYCDDSSTPPSCTCMPGWTGVRCEKLVTTKTTATIATPTTPSLACVAAGPTYCNSGTCIIVNNRVQCQCPPTQTGNRCETPTTATPSVLPPTVTWPTITPPTTTPQYTSCDQQPCQHGAPCYRTGNSYYCFCGTRYIGRNCETSVY